MSEIKTNHLLTRQINWNIDWSKTAENWYEDLFYDVLRNYSVTVFEKIS